MGIKTVAQPPYCPDLASFDFWLFPKLTGCHYETIEEMKEVVTKVIDTLTQEDFRGAFQKLLERYNKCIAAGGDYFEGDSSFMCVLSIKVPIQKKSGNLLYAPRISCFCMQSFSLILVLLNREIHVELKTMHLPYTIFHYCIQLSIFLQRKRIRSIIRNLNNRDVNMAFV